MLRVTWNSEAVGIVTMSGVNCDVSDETLQSCKEFLEEYPEAPNWDKSFVGQLMVSFLINKKTRIILLLTLR